MGAAVPVIGAIITSVVVSEAVGAVGEAIGLDENLTSMIGTVAGAVAGGYTYNAATASAAGAAGAGAGAAGAGTISNIPGTPIAPSAAPVSNIAGTPLAPAASQYASAPSAGATEAATRGGMLTPPRTPTIGAGAADPSGPMTTRAPAGTDTAGELIKANTVGTPDSPGEQSWAQRLFSPDKTMDLIMAGVQGYGQAGMAQEQMEYPEKIAEKNAADWAANYPGQMSLRQPNYPSQGGG